MRNKVETVQGSQLTQRKTKLEIKYYYTHPRGLRSCAIAMAIAHAIVSSKCAKSSRIKR